MRLLSVSAFLISAALPLSAQAPSATAVIAPFDAASAVKGSAVFTTQGGKLVMMVAVTGMTPGNHGLHIHAVGDCSAAAASGGHFDPDSTKTHGDPSMQSMPMNHHAGDLPMLVVDASGKGTATAMISGFTLGAGARSIIGKAIVIHADADDYKTNPAGNAGARIACGVIKAKQ